MKDCTYRIERPCFISWEEVNGVQVKPAENGGGAGLLIDGREVFHATWTGSDRAEKEALLSFVSQAVKEKIQRLKRG